MASENFCPRCGTANTFAGNNISQDNPSNASPTGLQPKRGLNKKPAIISASGIGAIIIIVIVSYSINAYALSKLQFRPVGGDTLDLATFSANGRFEACNPTSFPASFDKYHMVVLYKEKEFATVDIKGGTISPKQSTVLNGNIAIDRGMVVGLFIQSFANAFSGKQTQQFNQNDMSVQATLDAKILGLIPYTNSKTFSAQEFQKTFSSNTSYFCS